MHGLDFIPVCTERYDHIIPYYAWEQPSVQELIRILKSDRFRTRLNEMGGYTVDSPGTVREKF